MKKRKGDEAISDAIEQLSNKDRETIDWDFGSGRLTSWPTATAWRRSWKKRLSASSYGQTAAVLLYSPARQEFIGSLTGPSADDYFGRSILSLGDVNGDGLGDFAVGCPGADFTGTDAGSVYVYVSLPEPATLALLALAGSTLLARRRR